MFVLTLTSAWRARPPDCRRTARCVGGSARCPAAHRSSPRPPVWSAVSRRTAGHGGRRHDRVADERVRRGHRGGDVYLTRVDQPDGRVAVAAEGRA
ncbi:hypothetical protein QJS66_10130 [Kocuria rhizophila]|nr:hypothetical protein QJS66_10130 [Kocuria rhizophila]